MNNKHKGGKRNWIRTTVWLQQFIPTQCCYTGRGRFSDVLWIGLFGMCARAPSAPPRGQRKHWHISYLWYEKDVAYFSYLPTNAHMTYNFLSHPAKLFPFLWKRKRPVVEGSKINRQLSANPTAPLKTFNNTWKKQVNVSIQVQYFIIPVISLLSVNYLVMGLFVCPFVTWQLSFDESLTSACWEWCTCRKLWRDSSPLWDYYLGVVIILSNVTCLFVLGIYSMPSL